MAEHKYKMKEEDTAASGFEKAQIRELGRPQNNDTATSHVPVPKREISPDLLFKHPSGRVETLMRCIEQKARRPDVLKP